MTHRVAIVGAGPSGFYAADGLLRGRPDLHIDVIDRLPTPFGLVRAGVAPDHQGTKAVVRQFDRLLAQPDLRFAGNIEIGRDLTWDELVAAYDAVIVATGMVVTPNNPLMLAAPGQPTPRATIQIDQAAPRQGAIHWYAYAVPSGDWWSLQAAMKESE